MPVLLFFSKLCSGFRGLNSVAEGLAASRAFGGSERVQPEVPVTPWAALDTSPARSSTTRGHVAPCGFSCLTAPSLWCEGGEQLQTLLQLGLGGELGDDSPCNRATTSLCLQNGTVNHHLKPGLKQNPKADQDGSLLEKGCQTAVASSSHHSWLALFVPAL